MPHLVGSHHLEPGEVLVFVVIMVDHRRQKHLGAIGGSGIFVHPADVFVDQLLSIEDIDIGAGEGAAIEPNHALYAFQLQAGGQGFQQGLRGVGLNFEKGDATLGIFLQQLYTLAIPGFQLAHRNPVQHSGKALQEGWHRVRRSGQQPFAQVQYLTLRAGGGLSQGLSSVGEESGGFPHPDLCQTLAQLEKAAGLPLFHLAQSLGGQLQATLDLAPTALGQHPAHG